MSEPLWLEFARKDLGARETLGPNDSPFLRRMWASLSGSWLLGQPWCGGAVAHWMQQAGIRYPKQYYRARAWLDWGQSLMTAHPGAVVVFERGSSGHVGLVVGTDQRGLLLVLGGNQGDAVSIAPFNWSRVLGYRWPMEYVVDAAPLPRIESTRQVSTAEA